MSAGRDTINQDNTAVLSQKRQTLHVHQDCLHYTRQNLGVAHGAYMYIYIYIYIYIFHVSLTLYIPKCQ